MWCCDSFVFRSPQDLRADLEENRNVTYIQWLCRKRCKHNTNMKYREDKSMLNHVSLISPLERSDSDIVLLKVIVSRFMGA